jgi:hypothetical protein
MQTGIYLNALICFLIFNFSLFTASYIYKNNKNNQVDVSYAIFWFFTSLSWLFFAVSLLIFKAGYVNFSMEINQFLVQTTVFLQGIAIVYFAFYRLTKNKKFTLVLIPFFVALSIVGLYFNYQAGTVYLTKSTYYSIEYAISDISFNIFKIIFFLVFTAIGIDFFRNLYYWFKKNNLFEQKYFFASLSIIICGTIGYLEQSSTTTTWISMFFRMAIIFAAYTAYLAYSDKEIL